MCMEIVYMLRNQCFHHFWHRLQWLERYFEHTYNRYEKCLELCVLAASSFANSIKSAVCHLSADTPLGDGAFTVLWTHSQRPTLLYNRQQWPDGRSRALDCVAAISWRKLLPLSCATLLRAPRGASRWISGRGAAPGPGNHRRGRGQRSDCGARCVPRANGAPCQRGCVLDCREAKHKGFRRPYPRDRPH